MLFAISRGCIVVIVCINSLSVTLKVVVMFKSTSGELFLFLLQLQPQTLSASPEPILQHDTTSLDTSNSLALTSATSGRSTSPLIT